MKNPFRRKVNKALATMNDTLTNQPNASRTDANMRGLQVYTLSQLMAITGKTKDGDRVSGYYDQSIFYLNYDERISIYRLCAPVNAVVTGRMNTIAAMDFDIVPDKQEEDKIYDRLKQMKAVFDEYSKSASQPHIIAAGVLLKEIQQTLLDVLPDLSNFDKAALRWHRRIQSQKVEQGEWIKNWILQPNINDRYEEMTKKMVFDLMVHGAMAVYKEIMGGKVENFYLLPGGTVMPLKNKYVGGSQAYVQITNNVDEPLIYFGDELSYANYIPTSARSYGFVPLESLINMIAEDMLFNRLMADQADGTKMPEKMIVIANNNPFAGLEGQQQIPIDPSEQKRLENKINTPRKNAIMTFSGNTVEVVDLSRENTMEFQHARQKDIVNYVGMVFQASPMEMNLSGSENTSGRSTSEAQREIYHAKGVLPIVKIIEMVYNRDIIPYRFGPGWKMDYKSEKNDTEEMELLQKKMATGLFAVNEIRKEDLNLEPFDGDEFNKPPQSGAAQPDGSQTNPLNFRGME